MVSTLARVATAHRAHVGGSIRRRRPGDRKSRQYAGLEHHVVLVGQGSKFELWDEAKWQQETARTITFPAGGLPPELDGFSL